MTVIEDLIEPLRHSPLLPQIVERLSEQIAAERQRRNTFYAEMTPDQKVEFIDGEIVLHSPARNRHLDVTLRIAKLLDTFTKLSGIGEVKVEKCLCVFPRNDYEPDIVFFTAEKVAAFTSETLKFPVPDLIVEVLSDSTEHRDRGVKFEDFAANNVAEYWIVDADESLIEQFRLDGGQYQLIMKAASGRLQSTVLNGFEVDVEAFFDDAKNLVALRHLLK